VLIVEMQAQASMAYKACDCTVLVCLYNQFVLTEIPIQCEVQRPLCCLEKRELRSSFLPVYLTGDEGVE